MAYLFRRRKYLLSKEFQMKYALIVTLICAAITIALGFYITKLARENSNLIYELSDAKKNLLEVFGLIPDLNDSLKSKFEQETSMTEEKLHQTVIRNQRLPFFLAIFLLLIIIVIFMSGIIFTHRIIGPMYVFSQYLRQLIRGDIPEVRSLRSKDEFKDFRDDFATYVEEYKRTTITETQNEVRELQNILSLIEGRDVNRTLATETLANLIDDKQKEITRLSEDS